MTNSTVRTDERMSAVRPGPAAIDTVDPQPYHRLPRLTAAGRRWWRPLAIIAMTGLFMGIFALPMLVVAMVTDIPEDLEDLIDPRDPLHMFFLLASLAIGVPAVVLASRMFGGPHGVIHSVTGRFRWRLMRAAIVVFPVYAVVNWGAFWLFPPSDLALPPLTIATLSLPLLFLVLTPLQCAAEEYACRGLPLQVFGTWLRSPIWGIVLPVPFFILGHGYTGAGPVSLAVFSLCLGFLVWRTGGIELAVLVHTANNLTLFLIAPLSASSMKQGQVPWAILAFDIPFILAVTAGLTWWYARVHGQRFFQAERGTGRRPDDSQVPFDTVAARPTQGT